MSGILYLCATPIGNLGDISARCLEAFQNADLVACEDTRRTVQLLNHFGIKKQLTSYHEHNKREKGEVIVNLLKEGKNTFGIVLTRGWWSGRISFGWYNFKKVAAIAAFEISLADGEKISINTDTSWESTLGGPVRRADIYDGEYFDARIEYPFNCDGYKSWESCEIFDGFDGQLYLVLHSTNVNPNERPRIFKLRETDDGFEILERVDT